MNYVIASDVKLSFEKFCKFYVMLSLLLFVSLLEKISMTELFSNLIKNSDGSW